VPVSAPCAAAEDVRVDPSSEATISLSTTRVGDILREDEAMRKNAGRVAHKANMRKTESDKSVTITEMKCEKEAKCATARVLEPSPAFEERMAP